MLFRNPPVLLALAVYLAACGGGNTQSPVATAGSVKTASTQILERGAGLVQSEAPISAINTYLDGFHFYNGRLSAQMEAHHYCAILSEELIQCVIFDGNTKDAKLMGVEYVVSADLFANLPRDEKPLWHSHAHEVKSGQLIAPGVAEPAEHVLMEKLVRTCGKTWHIWHTDLDKQLPLGAPQLMMGFTQDGQVNSSLVAARDARFKVNTASKKDARSDIATPAIDAEADGWEHGITFQLPDTVIQRMDATKAATDRLQP